MDIQASNAYSVDSTPYIEHMQAPRTVPELHLATINARKEQSAALRGLVADFGAWLAQRLRTHSAQPLRSHSPARCG